MSRIRAYVPHLNGHVRTITRMRITLLTANQLFKRRHKPFSSSRYILLDTLGNRIFLTKILEKEKIQ